MGGTVRSKTELGIRFSFFTPFRYVGVTGGRCYLISMLTDIFHLNCYRLQDARRSGGEVYHNVYSRSPFESFGAVYDIGDPV